MELETKTTQYNNRSVIIIKITLNPMIYDQLHSQFKYIEAHHYENT